VTDSRASIAESRWLWRTIAILTILGAILVITAALPVRRIVAGVAGSKADDRAAPCLPGSPVELLPSPHIGQAEAASVKYNSDPPTSGPHYGFSIPAGIYSSRLPDALSVHALEHGHVVIQYGPAVGSEIVTSLDLIARRYAADVLLAPRESLGVEIALTAWGESIDSACLTNLGCAFVEGLRGRYHHGGPRLRTVPEGIPGSQGRYGNKWVEHDRRPQFRRPRPARGGGRRASTLPASLNRCIP
jgi:hypothetical protein